MQKGAENNSLYMLAEVIFFNFLICIFKESIFKKTMGNNPYCGGCNTFINVTAFVTREPV